MILCGGGHQHNCLLTPSSGRRFEVQRYDRGASTKNSSTEKGKIDNANDTGTNPIVSRLRFHSMRLRGGEEKYSLSGAVMVKPCWLTNSFHTREEVTRGINPERRPPLGVVSSRMMRSRDTAAVPPEPHDRSPPVSDACVRVEPRGRAVISCVVSSQVKCHLPRRQPSLAIFTLFRRLLGAVTFSFFLFFFSNNNTCFCVLGRGG